MQAVQIQIELHALAAGLALLAKQYCPASLLKYCNLLANWQGATNHSVRRLMYVPPPRHLKPDI